MYRSFRMASVAMLTLFALTLSGCATMFASGAETVRFDSEPSGAVVKTQFGQKLGTTPFTTSLDPSKNLVLTFQREGFEDATFSLNRTVDGIAYLNLLCVLCWGLDFATGSVWGYDTDFVKVDLDQAVAGLPAGTQQIALSTEQLTSIACNSYASLDEQVTSGEIDDARRIESALAVETATGVAPNTCTQ